MKICRGPRRTSREERYGRGNGLSVYSCCLLLLRHQLLLLPLHLVLLLLLLLLLQRLVLLLLVQILVVVQVLVLVRIEFFIIIIIFLHCMSCFVFQVTFREVDPHPQLCMKVILTVYFLTTHSLVLRYFYEAVFWTKWKDSEINKKTLIRAVIY